MGLSSILSSLTCRLRDSTAQRLPRHNATTIHVVAASLVVGYLTHLAHTSYRGYLALGKGGLPHNVLGWLIQGVAQLVAKGDTRSVAPFSQPKNRRTLGEAGARTFLGRVVVPERKTGDGGGGADGASGSGRPTVPGYVAPQRQIDQLLGREDGEEEKMRARMEGFLEDVVAANAGVLALKPSELEGVGTPALWLDTAATAYSGPSSSSSSDKEQQQQQQLPAFMKGLKGETAHVHPECSSHVTLSMADAEEVVRKGWAERHKLSGVGSYLPWTYLLVYAPRDDDELKVWKGIIKAGIRFVCAAAGREVAVDDV